MGWRMGAFRGDLPCTSTASTAAVSTFTAAAKAPAAASASTTTSAAVALIAARPLDTGRGGVVWWWRRLVRGARRSSRHTRRGLGSGGGLLQPYLDPLEHLVVICTSAPKIVHSAADRAQGGGSGRVGTWAGTLDSATHT